jgi:hypothetical protein
VKEPTEMDSVMFDIKNTDTGELIYNEKKGFRLWNVFTAYNVANPTSPSHILDISDESKISSIKSYKCAYTIPAEELDDGTYEINGSHVLDMSLYAGYRKKTAKTTYTFTYNVPTATIDSITPVFVLNKGLKKWEPHFDINVTFSRDSATEIELNSVDSTNNVITIPLEKKSTYRIPITELGLPSNNESNK